MEIPAGERLIPLRDVPLHLRGRKPQSATIRRWARDGVRGVKLESWLIGGWRHTTVEALGRFIERTTASADRSRAPIDMRSQRRQTSAYKAAIAALERGQWFRPPRAASGAQKKSPPSALDSGVVTNTRSVGDHAQV